jgi:hypothetical protein
VPYRLFMRNGPPPAVSEEARCRPDRRRGWRGGRRDADWIKRPLSARRWIPLMELMYVVRRRLTAWKRVGS